MKSMNKLLLPLAATVAANAFAADEVSMSSSAKMSTYDESVFKADPPGPEGYDYEAQLEIYGGKRQVETPRPLIEWGRKIYSNGTFSEESYIFGKTNPTAHQFTVYGDLRTAFAVNDFGGPELSRFSARMTLDFDWKLTATERLHVTLTPLNDGADITRADVGGTVPDDEKFVSDLTADSAFFEGDLGAIAAGFSGGYSKVDIPFAIGLMPLQFQNGIWMDDAITGVAASIISRNSRELDISNFDVTFFAGWDKVSSPFIDPSNTIVDRSVSIYGVAAFLDANKGYWELDYAYTDGRDPFLEDQGYHNVAIGFTRRYGAWLSNSVRVISNFGQDSFTRTADGTLLLVENSFITRMPYTLIPYVNLFISDDSPQSLARGDAQGGILKNVGINFESDNMSGYPSMVASANNMYGGAFGIEYLFGLNQQLVFEVAYSDVRDDKAPSGLTATGRQAAFGVRFQRNLTRTWLVRMDAMYLDNEVMDDAFGYRVELRRKF